MKASVTWVEQKTFLGQSGSGHAIVIDGAPEHGGRDLGIRPMELLLLGLAGCTAFDVIMILEKGREDIRDCKVEAQAERAETDPKVFTRIHLTYRVTGRKLSREKVERAVALSAEKYCSASIMLGKAAEISHEIEVIEAE